MFERLSAKKYTFNSNNPTTTIDLIFADYFVSIGIS